jgi:hypothetical protein
MIGSAEKSFVHEKHRVGKGDLDPGPLERILTFAFAERLNSHRRRKQRSQDDQWQWE